MKFVQLIGRILFSLIFILSAFKDFSPATAGYAASQGVPLASIAVPLAGVISLLGGLSILLGYKAKTGAWLLVLFLVPVTVLLHAFWKIDDPAQYEVQYISFMKNLSLIGTALVIAYTGVGPLSFDKGWGSHK